MVVRSLLRLPPRPGATLIRMPPPCSNYLNSNGLFMECNKLRTTLE